MQKPIITIFTDGASRGNPGPGGWGAVVVVGNDRVKELGGGEKHTTNNRMELTALAEALEYSKKLGLNLPIHIFTDSSYASNGATTWIHGWKKNNFQTRDKKDVLNRDLWERLDPLVTNDDEIHWHVVPGHSGIHGNERCDEIATSFADGNGLILFDGPLAEYAITDILDISRDEFKKEKKDRSKMKAYSYLSLVDGKAMRHESWADCKERVDGKSGVKFRKSVSPEDEKQILEEWGAKI